MLGKLSYVEVRGRTYKRLARLPEGDYPVTVEMFLSEWSRPRWPALHRLVRATVTGPEEGIWTPGKGTMDYNCGDDATFSMTCPAASPEEAVAQFVASILRDRARYSL